MSPGPENLLASGEPLLALDAIATALEQDPAHVRLRQLQALALARIGDAAKAQALLASLAAEGPADNETLALLARTHKDLALQGSDRERHLTTSRDLYARAFDEARARGAADEASYAGINAAAVSVLLGDLERARSFARDVAALGERASPGYWREATLGEAALILGDNAKALAHYAAATRLAASRPADAASTRSQMRLLSAHLPQPSIDPRAALPIRPVLTFTGHMIDAPGRPSPRFPATLEATVREALRQRIAAAAPLAVYGSAACGVDILCLEAAHEAGAETHIVLPFPPEDFRRASVDFAGGDWGTRFERALERAAGVTIASDHRASDSAATFEYANLLITGLALLRAQQLDTELTALTAHDAGAAGFGGGAASQAALWKARGIAVEHVDIAALRGSAAAPASAAPALTSPEAGHAIRAMLFADAVGYSRMSEDQIPRYIENFLGAVGKLHRETPQRAEHVEVAGDGLYFVFAEPGNAARFALALNALVRSHDWVADGLPPEFNLRIALHCGPVHCATDPLTGGRLYTGPHTSRAARIEPITPPGEVYASHAFAAVAAARGVEGLRFLYVGAVALAKRYGTLRLYRVLSR